MGDERKNAMDRNNWRIFVNGVDPFIKSRYKENAVTRPNAIVIFLACLLSEFTKKVYRRVADGVPEAGALRHVVHHRLDLLGRQQHRP